VLGHRPHDNVPRTAFSGSAHAATLTVNSPSDVVDTSRGNGICETVPGNGICTLRAAIMEANALAGADHIVLPSLPAPNAYTLTIVDELTISGSNLTIIGAGASTTIIDGNKGLRPNSGVLIINSGVTANISGVTIRNEATKFVSSKNLETWPGHDSFQNCSRIGSPST
jgi:hypothetical protein